MAKAQGEPGKRLKLKNVTKLIGESYEHWLPGDFVIIESQTGTGKTYFIETTLIKYLSFDNILFVCNRKNLERQIKRDVLKIKKLEVPSSLEELDKITKIKNVTITTYQAIQSQILNDEYFKNPFTKEYRVYDYIILDECHYILSDSSFNNTTRLVFDEFIRHSDLGAIKVFMTATTSEIKGPILQYIEYFRPRVVPSFFPSGGLRTEFEPKLYTSGIDYSYIKPKYFRGNKIDTIITLIKNDTSDDKWIVFVSNKTTQGKPLLDALGEDAVFITKDTKNANPELNSIITNSCFTKKVLITTKTLDNGINIKDKSVKHIVIIAWDMITFIQMLGRRRVDINNADSVNLYIPMKDIRSFHTLLKIYIDKLEVVNLYRDDEKAFGHKYDNDLKELSKYEDLIYRDSTSGNWTINPIGEWRLLADIEFMKHMINRFEDEGEFAFIREQLSWIGLEDTFSTNNLMEDVIPISEVERLEDYLCGLYESKAVMLMASDRRELIERINHKDPNKRLYKRISTLNPALEEMGSQYKIVAFETSKTENGIKRKFKDAWRIEKK